MAIQAQAGLQPQGIAGAETDGLDLGLVHKRPRHRDHVAGRHRDLETVFAGISGARDVAGDAVEGVGGGGHEPQFRSTGRVAFERTRRLLPLERQQRPVIMEFDVYPRQSLAEIGEIAIPAIGVDDQRQPTLTVVRRRAGHHQIVDDAAVIAEQHGVAHAARRQPDDVAGGDRLQGGGDGFDGVTDQRNLPHVGNVEEAGRRADLIVLRQNPRWVLQRHGKAGERDHAPAQLPVQAGQRGLARCFFGNRVAQGFKSSTEDGVADQPSASAPPLSGEPERFPP